MVKIALDAGHGRHTPGKRTPDDEREWMFNDKVLRACAAKLNDYTNVEVLRLDDPSGETDIPLQARTDRANAWKADVLVSIHHNASAGKWHGGGGVETYVFSTASTASRDIANRIHPRIVQAMGLRDRGIKTANLHMVRESRMPALLTEGGFMDSTVDIHSLRSDTILRKQGEAIAEGLAFHFKLQRKLVASTQTPAKEDVEMQFSSGTLRKTVENLLNSPTEQKKLIDDGIKSGSFGTVWRDKFEKKQLGKHDVIGLYMLHYN